MNRLICLAVLLAACSSDPVDTSGNYTVAITNRDNGCNFQNYTVGNMASGITVTITQQSANATADVTGATGAYLDLVLGLHAFSGTVDGNSLDLKLLGTRSQTTGNCTYTYNAEILAHLDGDVLTGKINYSPATNGNPDCSSITGCVTFQDFNGTRPPR